MDFLLLSTIREGQGLFLDRGQVDCEEPDAVERRPVDACASDNVQTDYSFTC